MKPGRECAPMQRGEELLSPAELDAIKVAPNTGRDRINERDKNMTRAQVIPSLDPEEVVLDLSSADLEGTVA